MDNSQYILDVMEGLYEAGKRDLISVSEHKRLADDLVDNAGTDMAFACLVEHKWDMVDALEDINYYGGGK